MQTDWVSGSPATGSEHVKSSALSGALRSTWEALKGLEMQGDVKQQGGQFVIGPGLFSFAAFYINGESSSESSIVFLLLILNNNYYNRGYSLWDVCFCTCAFEQYLFFFIA